MPKSSQELKDEFKRLKKQFDDLYRIKLNNTRRISRSEFDDLKKQVSELERQMPKVS